METWSPRKGEQGILRTFIAGIKETSAWLSFPDWYSTTNCRNLSNWLPTLHDILDFVLDDLYHTNKNYRYSVLALEVKFSASRSFSSHLSQHKIKMKYLPLHLTGVSSFLSCFCQKYRLVIEVKIYPGANAGRRLKRIKSTLPGAEPLGEDGK